MGLRAGSVVAVSSSSPPPFFLKTMKVGGVPTYRMHTRTR